MATTGTGIASFLAGFPNVRKQAAQAGFGKAPSITDVEKEAAALRGFLGTTDYASRLKESQDLAKLQIALAMAQRGFAGMSAQPQRGESSIGTLGRTLFSPLAGDIAPIAGRLMQQRQAAKAAEEKEDRDVKLAAYTQAATRGKDLDATALGILKAAAAKPSGITTSAIQNVNAEVQIDGETKKLSGVPIILRKDNEGRSRFYLAGAHQANDGTKVKADTELSSFKKVPTKDQLPKLYENIGKTTLNIPLQAKAGRSPSINLGPTKRASLHPNEFSQLPEAVRRDLVEYKAPPQAGGSLTTWINVSGTPQSINLPDFSTILEDGKEITLTAFQYSQLPEVMKVGNVLSRKEKPTIERGITGQEFKNGKFVDLNNVTRATKFINGAPVDTYYRQLAEGRLDKIPQDTFTETIATHGAFNKEDSIHIALLQDAAGNETGVVADALDDASAIAGGVVDVWRSRIEAPNKGTDRVRYYFKGTDVTDKIKPLVGTDAFQSVPLHSRDAQKAGHVADTRVFHTAATLTITGDNFARLKKILGPDVRPGEIVTVLKKPAQGDLLEEIEVRYHGNTVPLTRKDLDSNMLQERPLSQRQQETANFFSDVWQAGENLYVKPDTLDALNKKYPDLKATAGETVQVRRLKSDLKKSKLWLKDIFLSQADEREFLQARPLTQKQKRIAGQIDEPYVTYQNTGQITRMLPDGREVPPGGTISLTLSEYGALDAEARDALSKTQPTDAAGVRRIVTKAFKHDGISYFPGEWRTDNNAAFAALPPKIQQSLSDDPDLKKETLKKEHFKSFWKQVVDQQVNAGLMLKASPKAKPSEDDLSALLGQFPTGRRGVGKLRQAILDMIQLAPSAAEVSAGKAETEKLSYGDSIQKELNDAQKRYDTLLGKGIISGNQRWENLSYEAQRAFANVARGRINVAEINNQWEKAQEKLTKLKNNFKTPDANEVAAFNSSARLLILLKDLRDSNDLSKTGRFWEGFFSKLGVEVFSDFSPVTSAPSQRLHSIITDMQSSLKTLSGTEGVDGRPSNFRLQLQQDLLPAFNRPEALNKRNLDVIISKLENNIRGVFTPEIAGKYIIPQSFVRSAREAGILNANVDPRRYPFVNPNEAGPPGVTRKDVLRGFGKDLYSLADFESLRTGQTLPADNRGRILVKVSKTHVQYALPDGMPDPKSPQFPAADMFKKRPVD